MPSWFVWPPPAAPAALPPCAPGTVGAQFQMVRETKYMAQLLVPAHQPALLPAGTLGSLPNPLQGQGGDTFPSGAEGKGQTGTNKWLEVAEPSLGVTAESEQALLRRSRAWNAGSGFQGGFWGAVVGQSPELPLPTGLSKSSKFFWISLPSLGVQRDFWWGRLQTMLRHEY